jgi:hypothetical protein
MAITVYVFRIFKLASRCSPGTSSPQVDPTELAGRAHIVFRQVPLDLEVFDDSGALGPEPGLNKLGLILGGSPRWAAFTQ